MGSAGLYALVPGVAYVGHVPLRRSVPERVLRDLNSKFGSGDRCGEKPSAHDPRSAWTRVQYVQYSILR